MITFEKDRARIGPALKKKDPEMKRAPITTPLRINATKSDS